MTFLETIMQFITRFRYPVSLPQDVAFALGIEIANNIKFPQMLNTITQSSYKTTKLAKHMPRELAESAFHFALRKEQFGQKSLFSYYFSEGWLEFELQFDTASCLRRVYIHHRLIHNHHGVEIPLREYIQKPSPLMFVLRSNEI